MRLLCCLAVLGSLFAVSCGGTDTASSGVSEEDGAKVKSTAEIKKTLEGIAASGEAGSSLMGLRASIESLSTSDADKSKELLADLDTLEKASSADEVKKLAKGMSDKL